MDHNYKMKNNILFINIPFKILKHFYSTNIKPILSQKIKKYCESQRLHQRDVHAQSILQAMKSIPQKKNIVISRLVNYLQHTERQQKRTPKGLLSLVWATNQCEDAQIKSYCRHCIQYIIRSEDVSEYKCNKYELSAILAQLSARRSQAYQKIKQSMIKYKTAEIIMLNKQVVSSVHFFEIMSLLTSTQRMTVTTNSRFLSLAEILTQKMLAHFKPYINGSYEHKVYTSTFINSTMYYFREYPPQHIDDTNTLFKFLSKAVFDNNRQFKKIILYNIHRCFPYCVKDEKGKYYKDIILDKIIERQKKMTHDGQDWNDGLLSYSILSFQFYKAMDQIQFRQDGQFNYLLRQQICIPELPPFFWDKYKQIPSIINKDHIARNILKKVYPDKYISTPQVQSMTIKPPKVTENEVKVRMDLALERLNIKSQKQVQICGRYVDFLIGDVIIECDGDHHFDLYRMDYDQSTHFRNLHLLLSGYRLLIINIFQYNHYRKTQALAELVSKKLSILNKHKAAMIL